jgi:hypothetical protein
MIQQNDAVKLADGTIAPQHTVEIYCPNCSRDVDEAQGYKSKWQAIQVEYESD